MRGHSSFLPHHISLWASQMSPVPCVKENQGLQPTELPALQEASGFAGIFPSSAVLTPLGPLPPVPSIFQSAGMP